MKATTEERTAAELNSYPCHRWNYRLNRMVGNGWTNDIRGDLQTNLPSRAAAIADRIQRARAERAADIARATTAADAVGADGGTFAGLTLGDIMAAPNRALRVLRAAIMHAEGAEEERLALAIQSAKKAAGYI